MSLSRPISDQLKRISRAGAQVLIYFNIDILKSTSLLPEIHSPVELEVITAAVDYLNIFYVQYIAVYDLLDPLTRSPLGVSLCASAALIKGLIGT